MLSLIRYRTVKKRTILFGLKADNCSREILLRLLSLVVKPGDYVLAIHVQVQNDSFNPNIFHIHEDICKSKQVDFQVKVCEGDSYISKLTRQVRENYATILALGCSISGPKSSVVNTCLKGLPPTCSLLMIDNRGRILLQKQGTCQQGSIRRVNYLQPSPSLPSKQTGFNQSTNTRQLQKSLTIPSWLPTSSLQGSKKVEVDEFSAQKLFSRLAILDAKGCIRQFTSEELKFATNSFNSAMVIGEGGHSKVYLASLDDGRAAAVKVLTEMPPEELREVEILADIKHENIVEIIGYCVSKDMNAIVYNLMKGSLRQYLRQLRWRERMSVAISVAKALTYLHHSCSPPIIHRDVKSSNILLDDNCQSQLSDFGAAALLEKPEQAQANAKPFNVVGTFGYLAPEYMMYGKVDEKIDVYSYGVVLLELITGKEAIQKDQTHHESLVLWARSLLGCGVGDRLIDPHLNDDYNKEEMEVMMMVARLCLLYSSSRRPTMKTILRLFEEPEYLLKMQKARENLLNKNNIKGTTRLLKYDGSNTDEMLIVDDIYSLCNDTKDTNFSENNYLELNINDQ